MKLPALMALAFGLSACAQLQSDWEALVGEPEPVGTQVEVMGRTWTVSRNELDTPGTWMAVRDNNNFNPFGRPAHPRTPQAVQALEKATGCKVVGSSLYQNTSAEFFGDVSCPPAS